jgi:hypothetical protein
LMATFARYDTDGSQMIELPEFGQLWEHIQPAEEGDFQEEQFEEEEDQTDAAPPPPPNEVAPEFSTPRKSKFRTASRAVIAAQRMDPKLAAATANANEAVAMAQVAQQELEAAHAEATRLQEEFVASPTRKASDDAKRAKKALGSAEKVGKKAAKKAEKEIAVAEKLQSKAAKRSESQRSPLPIDEALLSPQSPRVAPPPNVLLPLIRGVKVLLYERVSEAPSTDKERAKYLKQLNKKHKAEESTLIAELKKLTVGDLRVRCQQAEVETEQVEEARDSDNPKKQLTQLLVERARSGWHAELAQPAEPAQRRQRSYAPVERLLCIDMENMVVRWKPPQAKKFEKACTFPVKDVIQVCTSRSISTSCCCCCVHTRTNTSCGSVCWQAVHGPGWSIQSVTAARATHKKQLSLFSQGVIPNEAMPWELFTLCALASWPYSYTASKVSCALYRLPVVRAR